MFLEDLFKEDAPYEEQAEVLARCRAGRLAYQLGHGRVYMDPQLRQLVGYMLEENNWLTDPIDLMMIEKDGLVWARLSYRGSRKTPLQAYFNGPSRKVQKLMPYADVDFILGEVRDMCRRAELDEDDTEWLLGLPRVRDRRPEFQQPED